MTTTALFDFTHPPFDSLTPAERAKLESALDIEYFATGATLLKRSEPVPSLFVLIKGLVSEPGASASNELLASYVEHDCFDSRALINGVSHTTLTAIEDSIVFAIARDTVIELTHSNPMFGAFFFQDVAKRLSTLAHQPHQQAMQSTMLAKVDQAFIREAVWLGGEACVWEAAHLMREAHTYSVLVRITDTEFGIFTQSDLRDFVIDGGEARTAPLAPLAHTPILSVQADQPIHLAMLLMTRHTIQRVVVKRGEEIIGVLEQVDLLSFLYDHSHMIGAQIERAHSLEDLKEAWNKADELIRTLYSNGIKVTLIANLVSELRLQLYARIFSLIAPAEVIAHTCLLALGSEGRGEQILKTDQDNALIVEEGYGHPDLEKICRTFNDTLIEFGYPSCSGGVMVQNGKWRRNVSGFKAQMNLWLQSCSGENMRDLAIWVDAYPVCGKVALFDNLREYWRRNMDSSPTFLAHFARAIEQFDTPLDLFSRLVTGSGKDARELDLKKGGIFPLVHGVRALALEAGLKCCNTYLRIDELAQSKRLSLTEAQDLTESLAFLQSLQLKYGLAQQARGQRANNLITPSELTTLERDLLKDTFAVVKRFKQHLRHHYRLNAM